MKICTKCKAEKPIEDFFVDLSHKDGHCSRCKVCLTDIHARYRSDHKKTIAVQKAKSYQKNKTAITKNHAKYRKANYKKISIKVAEYFHKHRNKIDAYQLAYRRNNRAQLTRQARIRRHKDPLFRFQHNLRTLIGRSFLVRGFKKNTKTIQILGCTIAEFRKYLESLFLPGMTFENHGKWHLDHIVPISTAKTTEEVIRLCHHTNFQPLWAKDNIRKGNKT
jgi:hypothetical protein